MKKIVFFTLLMASFFVVTNNMYAQENLPSGSVQEMNRDMKDLTKSISNDDIWQQSSTTFRGVITNFQLHARVETYVGRSISFDTDSLTECHILVYYDQSNDEVLFFGVEMSRKGETNLIEYDPGTQKLTLNRKEAVGLSDQMWMVIGNICLGNFKVIK